MGIFEKLKLKRKEKYVITQEDATGGEKARERTKKINAQQLIADDLYEKFEKELSKGNREKSQAEKEWKEATKKLKRLEKIDERITRKADRKFKFN